MSIQIIIGFTTEGSTDVRLLENIIQRTFEYVAFECIGQVEVLPVQYIEKQNGDFVELVKDYARQAEERGVMVLCVHTDADDTTDTSTFNNKINPAFTAVNDIQVEPLCKNLVAIVPVRMTESWMLSDKELLRAEIGTSKGNEDLGIDRRPEVYNNPKQTIEDAIRIARQNLTKRRRHELTIAELYSPIGQKVALSTLERLPSYQKFKEAVRGAYIKMNYLYD